MGSALRMAISMLLLMTVLLGLAYPLAITGIAQLVFPHQANGSLVRQGETVIGGFRHLAPPDARAARRSANARRRRRPRARR